MLAGCSTKVPALTTVQNAEATVCESLTELLCPFCTAFSTKVLKTSVGKVHGSKSKAARMWGGLSLAHEKINQQPLPTVSDRCRSSRERSAHHRVLRVLPSSGSSFQPAGLRA